MRSIRTEAFKRKLFVTDGFEKIRTEPLFGQNEPFIGFIKTTIGEAKVSYDNKTLTDTMAHGGREITEKEYWS